MSHVKRAAIAVFAVAVMGSAVASSAKANYEYDEIYIKNETNRTIWVAINYMAPGQAGFASMGYWSLAPGERAYVADSGSQYIYFHAHDAFGNVWGDTHSFYVNGDLRDFFQVYTGTEPVIYTQRFTN